VDGDRTVKRIATIALLLGALGLVATGWRSVARVSVRVAAEPGRGHRDRDPPLAASEAVPAPELSPDSHPHPITPEREHIQRELQLVGALNDAVDLHDVSALRQLTARYREHEPDDANALGAGYALIADCLQFPGPETRSRAQRYYDLERASTLRRYVRRTCLEP
jgi:hypothetical protein